MKHQVWLTVSIVIFIASVGAALWLGSRATDIGDSTNETESQGETVTSPSERFGVVTRRTDPETGQPDNYEIRGIVVDEASVDNNDRLVFSLDTNEDGAADAVFSLGQLDNRLGYLDRANTSNGETGNHYTSGTAEEVASRIDTGEEVLVRIPVRVDTSEDRECDQECQEYVDMIRENGDRYSTYLESVLGGGSLDTSITFNVNMVEIGEQ